MVNSQGYARFKVDAPEAKSVTVTLGLGGSGGTKLEKQADGSWMGTTAGPMDEGFHYYHLIVDDGTFNDPAHSTTSAHAVGKAVSRFPPTTVTSMP